MFHTVVNCVDRYSGEFRVLPEACKDVVLEKDRYGQYSACPKCGEPIVVLNRRKQCVQILRTITKKNGSVLQYEISMVARIFFEQKKVAFFNIKQKLKTCANPSTGFIKGLKSVAAAYPELQDSPLKTLKFIPASLRHSIKSEGFKEEKAYKVLFKTHSKDLRNIIREYPFILNHARRVKKLFSNFDYYIRYLDSIKYFFKSRRATHIFYDGGFVFPEQIQYKISHEFNKFKFEIKKLNTMEADNCQSLNSTDYDFEYVQDTFNLIIQILKWNSELKLGSYSTLRELHDDLSKIQRTLEFKDQKIQYDLDDYDFVNFEYNGYFFKLIDKKMDFWNIGEAMHNCVLSYFTQAEMYRSRIIVAYKGAEPKICIELNGKSGNRIAQARLKCNEDVTNDEESLEALEVWVKEKKLSYDKSGFGYF